LSPSTAEFSGINDHSPQIRKDRQSLCHRFRIEPIDCREFMGKMIAIPVKILD
jgi:hypothetical protein